MPTIPGPFPLTGTYFPTWAFQGSAIGSLTISPRSMADRIASSRNVLDYGVAGDGSTDDAAALTACFAQNGFWYLPPATYHLGSSITLPNPGGYVGAGICIFGYGATFEGNFADWLLQCPTTGTDYFGPKLIAGIVFLNKNNAGGLVYARDSSQLRMVDCTGQMDGGPSGPSFACSLGFIFVGSNGSYQVQNCTLVGGNATNQVGIAVPAGLGSLVECCNLHGGFERAIMVGGGGAAGGRASCNRLETNYVCILAGWGGDYQKTVGNSTASGSNTVLPLTNTLMFTVGQTVNVPGTAADGSAIASKTATSITLSTGSFVSLPSGTWINLYGPGGAGVHIESNEGEANAIPIYLMGSQGAVVQANNFQMYNGVPNGGFTAQGGVAFGDGVASAVIEGNSITGICSDSVYFYNGVFRNAGGLVLPTLTTGTPSNANNYNAGQVLIQNNALPAELCMVQAAVTNGNVFSIFSLPRWLDDAINIHPVTVYISSPFCTIASTTTVTGASSSTLTLSANISGTQPQWHGFYFWTDNLRTIPLGQVSAV